MLYSNINSFDFNDYVNIQKAHDFLKKNDLSSLPFGRSNEEGDSFYCQKLEYDTEQIDNFNFDIHEKRLDLHYIVEGDERIDVSLDDSLVKYGEYNEDRDLQFVNQPNNFKSITLHAGDFILIGMHEPHRTNGIVKHPTHVHKIVLKIGR